MLLAVSKDGVGTTLALIGLVVLVIVLVSMLIRNRVDRIEPRMQAVLFWVIAVGTSTAVGSGSFLLITRE